MQCKTLFCMHRQIMWTLLLWLPPTYEIVEVGLIDNNIRVEFNRFRLRCPPASFSLDNVRAHYNVPTILTASAIQLRPNAQNHQRWFSAGNYVFVSGFSASECVRTLVDAASGRLSALTICTRHNRGRGGRTSWHAIVE